MLVDALAVLAVTAFAERSGLEAWVVRTGEVISGRARGEDTEDISMKQGAPTSTGRSHSGFRRAPPLPRGTPRGGVHSKALRERAAAFCGPAGNVRDPL